MAAGRLCHLIGIRQHLPSGRFRRDIGRYRPRMLLSDRDIKAAVEAKRIVLEPYDPAMVQPSSIDIRLDRYFRVFENHRYPHIDPAQEQADLTRLVDTKGDEAFVLSRGTAAGACRRR